MGEAKEADVEFEEFAITEDQDGDILVGGADHDSFADLERLGEFVFSECGDNIAFADACVCCGCIEVDFLDTDSPRRKQPAFGVGNGLESDAKPRREGDLFAFKGERAEVFCGGGVFFAERGLFALDKVVQAAPIAEVIGVLAVLEQETTRDAK